MLHFTKIKSVVDATKFFFSNFGTVSWSVCSGACIIKPITAVIYGFYNKYLSLNTRLGWKGLPGTNLLITETVNYDRNKFYNTGPRSSQASILRLDGIVTSLFIELDTTKSSTYCKLLPKRYK